MKVKYIVTSYICILLSLFNISNANYTTLDINEEETQKLFANAYENYRKGETGKGHAILAQIINNWADDTKDTDPFPAYPQIWYDTLEIINNGNKSVSDIDIAKHTFHEIQSDEEILKSVGFNNIKTAVITNDPKVAAKYEWKYIDLILINQREANFNSFLKNNVYKQYESLRASFNQCNIDIRKIKLITADSPGDSFLNIKIDENRPAAVAPIYDALKKLPYKNIPIVLFVNQLLSSDTFYQESQGVAFFAGKNVALVSSVSGLGIGKEVTGHEVGHLLGLQHVITDNDDNLMEFLMFDYEVPGEILLNFQCMILRASKFIRGRKN